MSFFSKEKIKQLKPPEEKVKRHTLLLVDDEQMNLQTLAELLEHNYHLLVAEDGQKALELIHSHDKPEQIHMIISDQRMPHMSGVEFLKRSSLLIPKTIRILLTGYIDVEDIIDSINEGQIYKFITKPYEPKELVVTIKRALEVYDLEEQNILLSASNRKLADLNQTKEQLLQKLYDLYENDLRALEEIVGAGMEGEGGKEAWQRTARGIQQIKEGIRPITKLYFSEQTIRNKRILLAENNKRQQVVTKMALGGTGMELDIASDLEVAEELVRNNQYDVICVNTDFTSLVEMAHQRNPNIYSVFMTSEDAPRYLPILKKFPMISNIVSCNEDDRTFTIKNMLTTVSKLLNQDLFGMEKYLNWGVEVSQHTITGSRGRHDLIESMEEYFKDMGVRRPVIQKCGAVVEELLTNAIYDAPTDAEGKPIYNHMDRKETIELKKEEQGSLRYACDGILLGVSVEDPFGAFTRHTVLDYLESCYSGQAGSLQESRGSAGAGRGLFQIMSTADLVVWNVKPKIKTEVIAIFNLDPHAPKSTKATSFHYFSE